MLSTCVVVALWLVSVALAFLGGVLWANSRHPPSANGNGERITRAALSV